jgi:hypothetical protein
MIERVVCGDTVSTVTAAPAARATAIAAKVFARFLPKPPAYVSFLGVRVVLRSETTDSRCRHRVQRFPCLKCRDDLCPHVAAHMPAARFCAMCSSH